MPNCFSLFKKGETVATSLSVIDDEICDYLAIEPDPTFYAFGWFDSIGMLIACCEGCDLGSEKLRDKVIAWTDDPDRREHLLCILNYLEEHYTSESWAEVGRR